MKKEVLSAVNFLIDLLRRSPDSTLTEVQIKIFRDHVCERLWIHYKDHWFPEKPLKGSGYRCIRINGKMDPLFADAASSLSMSSKALRGLFPSELTMWIDPSEVSYRIGENGSICVLYGKGSQSESGQPQSPKSNTSSTQQPSTPSKAPSALMRGLTSSPSPALHKRFSPSKPLTSSPPPYLSRQQCSPSPPHSPITPPSQHLSLQQQQQHLFYLMNSHSGNNCKDTFRSSNLDSVRGMERLFVSS